jgi:hypothetical protein
MLTNQIINTMPKGDHTGPLGQGPATGKSLGFCSGYDSPGYTGNTETRMFRRFRRGMGSGHGMGYGRGMNLGRSRFSGLLAPQFNSGFFRNSVMNKEDEIWWLKSQADALKHFQQDIEKRLNELESEYK